MMDRYARDPVAFIDAFIPFNEKGQAWRLSAYQRRVLALAFQWSPLGRLLLRLLLWSEAKKSGKTMIAACLVVWWGFTRASTEVICCANDYEQALSRVFGTVLALCRHNPELKRSVRPLASELHISNATVIRAIASDYKGAAGSRHSLVVFDEMTQSARSDSSKS
jgi:phage terminase large subunit-like protein